MASVKFEQKLTQAVLRKKVNHLNDVYQVNEDRQFDAQHRLNLSLTLVDAVTTDGSDIERRIRTYQDQVQKKKTELDQLKQRKNKEVLRKREEELKKQLEVRKRIFWHSMKFLSLVI